MSVVLLTMVPFWHCVICVFCLLVTRRLISEMTRVDGDVKPYSITELLFSIYTSNLAVLHNVLHG